jgi:hypothetical protein
MIKSKLLKVITLATGLMTAGASFGIANGDIFAPQDAVQLH